MTVAIDHVPIRTNAEDARVAAVPVDVVSTCAATAVSIFRIYSMYEPLKVFMTLGADRRRRRRRGVDALPRRLDPGRRRRPRAVADPRRRAVQRRGRAGRAGHHRRPAERPADHAAADLRARAPARAAQPRSRRRTTSRAPRPTGQPPTTGANAGEEPKSERPSSCEHDVTRDAEGTVTGNTYDKYGSSNPVVKKLMAGFERTLDELWAKASPRSRAGRRLRRGRAHAQVGAAPARRPHRRHRPRGPGDPGRVGQAPGAEPRVQDHEGRDVPVRGRRVRARVARSRCSSTCRTPSTPSPRWRASPAAVTCSSASRASRCGAA